MVAEGLDVAGEAGGETGEAANGLLHRPVARLRVGVRLGGQDGGGRQGGQGRGRHLCQ